MVVLSLTLNMMMVGSANDSSSRSIVGERPMGLTVTGDDVGTNDKLSIKVLYY